MLELLGEFFLFLLLLLYLAATLIKAYAALMLIRLERQEMKKNMEKERVEKE